MRIEELISDLLVRNNCVVIPGFGGFVANVVSAKIDYKTGVVYPPMKALTFNKSLQNNDGLLVSELASAKGLSYDAALNEVNDFSKAAQHQLNTGERVSFDKVGFLFKDNSGAVRFEQDRFFNLLMESYGLGYVKFIPEQVVNQSDKNKKETVSSEEILIVHPSTNKFTIKKAAKYVAAAALLPVLFYSFWIPVNTDVLQSGVIYRQDFNPLQQKVESIYGKSNSSIDLSLEKNEHDEPEIETVISGLPSSVSSYSFKLNEDTYIPVKLPNNDKDNTPIIHVSANYHLIAGCFGNKENADNLMADLKAQGFNAYIVDYHKGLHRVSVAQGNGSAELNSDRQKLSSLGFKTWVLKK